MILYHVTDRENAAEILKGGFLGGWGDVGYGVYFYGNPIEAQAYAKKGGWDRHLTDPVMIEVEVEMGEIEKVIPEPSWPNPEAYTDVWYHPMADDEPDGAETPWVPKRMKVIDGPDERPAQISALGKLIASAVEESSIKRVRQLLDEGASPNSLGSFGDPIVVVAAGYGNAEICRMLIDAGADVMATNRSSMLTGLHAAAKYGYESICRMFLDSGVSPATLSSKGDTPLHLAAESAIGDRLGTCRLLVERGADLMAKGYKGSTPLHRAAVANELEAADYLLSLGCDADAQDDNKETPLAMASINSHQKMCCLLVSYGADAKNDIFYRELTPLQAAVRGGLSRRIVDLLEQAPEISSDEVESLRRVATSWNQPESMALVDATMARRSIAKLAAARHAAP